MTHLKRYLSISAVLFLFLPPLTSYVENLHTNKDDTSGESIGSTVKNTGDLAITDSSACDGAIWNHVYNPARLNVVNKCITVTGVITESHAEADGDQHLLLRLDAEYEHFLNKRNNKSKKGNLVIEAVCVNNITEKKVGGACKGYVNQVKLPVVGSHVKVTGTYVIDTHNGWAEIHPVSKIELR